MRKTWMRQVNAEGQAAWLRDATQPTGPDAEALVVVFGDDAAPTEPEPPTAMPSAADERDDKACVAITVEEIDGDGDGETDDTTENAPTKVVAAELTTVVPSTASTLDAEVAAQAMRLVESRAADASRFPVLSSRDQLVNAAELKRLVVESQHGFPAKVASFIAQSVSVTARTSKMPSLTAYINRERLLEESIRLLSDFPRSDVSRRVRIQFDADVGVDAGGVYREWFLLVCEELVKPSAGVFRCVDAADQVFYLDPHSRHILGDNHLAHFFATGRFLGRALLEGNVTGFHLALPLLKIILGQPLSLSDLEFFDPETYRNLTWLLNNDGADALGLDFSVCEQVVMADGSTQTMVVDLIPNGRDVEVTDTNKALFVDRKFRYMVFESVSSQLYALLKGVYEVVPPEMLMLFDAEELDYVLSGSDEIDVDDWKRNSKWTADLIEHPVLEWFWEIVREMPNKYRRRLLQFSTGSSRVPLAGFSALTSYDGRLCPFTLKGVSGVVNGSIHGHACFNRLDLPKFRKREDLWMAMKVIVVEECVGFTTS
ncbi:hypothetical protein PINS_up015540 [Pythium insidiosum]|nr:hypothetical protein PINS_up015540 [Pythium insidiosum]